MGRTQKVRRLGGATKGTGMSDHYWWMFANLYVCDCGKAKTVTLRGLWKLEEVQP